MLKKSWINVLLIFLPLLAGVVELILITMFAQALPPYMLTADFGVFARARSPFRRRFLVCRIPVLFLGRCLGRERQASDKRCRIPWE